MTYAATTLVSVDRSQGELRKILLKYGATGFAFGEQVHMHTVMFEMQGRRIRFNLPMPDPKKFSNQKSFEQKQRSQWRCLVLAVKAKLQSVESQITTLEEEFLAHIVLPNGRTTGEVMIPQIAHAYEDKKMPPLLGYSG